MRILIVGSGGREHALAWKLSRERTVEAVLCAPGNAGTAHVAHTAEVDVGDASGLVDLARRERIDLTVIGPELPLDRGVADRFRDEGLRVFGPLRAAAQLECSKVFAKGFMARHGIPTARYSVCSTAAEAFDVLASGAFGLPVVIKADGLAAGKGVVVASDRATAEEAVRASMEHRRFGEAGARVVIEECLVGREVSFFAVCDGTRAVPVTSAQDHKRIFDDDEGPNTGGMGAFAPSPLLDPALEGIVMRAIVEPVLRGMRAEGTEYRGFLYAGLMLTCSGPKVIEFNVRFGDPEAQAVMPLIADDLAPLLAGAADGQVGVHRVGLREGVAVGVVLASAGYPGTITRGKVIAGLEDAGAVPDVTVFHSGTAARDGQIVTAGGRVLTVVARAEDLRRARERAYEGVSKISFDGMQYRRDIGLKALNSPTH